MKKQTLLTAVFGLILTMALFTGCSQPNATADAVGLIADTGTIILRVNPEVSVHYNKEGLVTKIEGLNDDGTAIVAGYSDYIGKDCKTVVQDLVQEINKAGYFVTDVDGKTRSITIQIEPGSVLPADDFLQTIAADVQTTVAQMNKAANVVNIGQSDYDRRYATADAPSAYITRDKAAEIALTHAGIAASDAVFDDREFDFENNRAVYELEFMSGGQEYEYDIDAKTAKVLRNQQGDSGYGDTTDNAQYGIAAYGDTVTNPNNSTTTDDSAPASTPNPGSTTDDTATVVPPANLGDTDYGPNNDGVTDYGDTDYGPNNDGVTDYGDTDYGPNNDGVTDYGDTDYGPNNDGVTDYGDTDYGPNNDGVTDYGNSNYGNSTYGDSGYDD